MKKSIYSIALIIIIMFFSVCKNTNNKTKKTKVKFYGALRTIMSGNIQPVISLDSLSNKKHFYALGAVENLKGEIQIFDSKPSNSFVFENNLQIKGTYSLKAALIVSSEVEEWDSFQIENIKVKSDLEAMIFETAKNNGINVEKPFPFLLEGRVASLDWHVINWKEGDTIHSHKKHKEAGLKGTIKNRQVQIIGFYSTKHKAIFTHHTTNMHMHFKTEDNTIAGHIDDLILNQKITLKLPKQ